MSKNNLYHDNKRNSKKKNNKAKNNVLLINNDKGGVTPSNICCEVTLTDKIKGKIIESFSIDCGVSQGKDSEVKPNFSSRFKDIISRILIFVLTHSHIDHIAGLGDVEKEAMDNHKKIRVLASKGTFYLMEGALLDNCKLQANAAHKARKQPSHDIKHVEQILNDVEAFDYEETAYITDNIKVTFFSNGHICGSSKILVEIIDPNGVNNINLFFTGDLKLDNPLVEVKDLPDWVKELPLIFFTESTYGTTTRSQIKKIFDDEIVKFMKSHENDDYWKIVIPAFSTETTQVILNRLKELQEKGIIDEKVRIILDGNLSQKQTKTILKHPDEFHLKEDKLNFLPKNLIWADYYSREGIVKSRNTKDIYVVSGGMLQGISKFYIQRLISDINTLFFIIGYKPPNTSAYRFANAKPGDIINIYGADREVKAEICWTREFSSHAMSDELISFLKQFKNIRTLFVVHGEDDVRDEFIKEILNDDELKSIIKEVRKFNYKTAYRVDAFGIIKEIPTES